MLLIIAAVPLETSLLRQQLIRPATQPADPGKAISGKICNQQVLLTHSGVGQVAMAIRLTRLLGQIRPEAVLLCGCGGSYPHSDLQIGDLAIASEEIYGDLGVSDEDRFIPLDQLDIPQQPDLMPEIRQSYSLDPGLVALGKHTLPQARVGTFVSINSCSGHPALSEELHRRTGGICENMEGAAAAQVCADFNIPLFELRGISNPTGSRSPQDWDIKKGAEVAQTGLLKILQSWPKEQDQA